MRRIEELKSFTIIFVLISARAVNWILFLVNKNVVIAVVDVVCAPRAMSEPLEMERKKI